MARYGSAVQMQQQLPAGAKKPDKSSQTAERIKIINNMLASKATTAERREYFAEMSRRMSKASLKRALESLTPICKELGNKKFQADHKEARRLRRIFECELRHLVAKGAAAKKSPKQREGKAVLKKKPAAATKKPTAKATAVAPTSQKVVSITSAGGARAIPQPGIEATASPNQSPATTPAPATALSSAPTPAAEPAAANEGPMPHTEWRNETGTHPSVGPNVPVCPTVIPVVPAPSAPVPITGQDVIQRGLEIARSLSPTGRPSSIHARKDPDEDFDLTSGAGTSVNGGASKPPWPEMFVDGDREERGGIVHKAHGKYGAD